MTFFKILSKKNRLKIGLIVILTILLSTLEFLVFSFIEPIINSFSQNNSSQKISLFFTNNLGLKELLIFFFILYLIRISTAITLSYLRNFTLKKIFDEISSKILTGYLNQRFIFFLSRRYSKLLSNIQEVKARGGRIIMITDRDGAKKVKKYCDQIVIIPKTNFLTSPILYSIPVQLIAYYLAVFLGTDVDQPRNLAKSVTVE